MPAVVLSAVVFLIGSRLIDVSGFREVYRSRRDEFWIAAITAATVACVGVEPGILMAIAISVIDHLRVSYHPPTRLLKISQQTRSVVEVPVASEEMAFPGMMIYRFNAPLYYANSDFFMQEVLRLVKNAKSQVKWLVVRFDSISDVDFSASKMLLLVVQQLGKLGVTTVFSDVNSCMRDLLERYGIVAALGPDKVFDDLAAAVKALTSESTLLDGSARNATSDSSSGLQR